MDSCAIQMITFKLSVYNCEKIFYNFTNSKNDDTETTISEHCDCFSLSVIYIYWHAWIFLFYEVKIVNLIYKGVVRKRTLKKNPTTLHF